MSLYVYRIKDSDYALCDWLKAFTIAQVKIKNR